jgi:hypothetical protein
MNVLNYYNIHPAVKIMRIDYTSNGIKRSYLNFEKIKKEAQLTNEELIQFRVWLKEKEVLKKTKKE